MITGEHGFHKIVFTCDLIFSHLYCNDTKAGQGYWGGYHSFPLALETRLVWMNIRLEHDRCYFALMSYTIKMPP